jgi:iron complex transport system ATP-binding protein
MTLKKKEILTFESLLIGYKSGKTRKVLLPPLSACAHEGELIAVVGQNGIGKSTLLRTLAGLQGELNGAVEYRLHFN